VAREGVVRAVAESPREPRSDAVPPTAPTPSAKEKFREALERKNAAPHRAGAGTPGTSAVHGPEVSNAGRRMFRRKSG
jgi:hypothetical protein